MNPIVAAFLGWLVLHEPFSSRLFLAALIIITGVAIITLAKNKMPAAAVAAPATSPDVVLVSLKSK